MNVLDFKNKRKVITCNFSYYSNSIHPSRIFDDHILIYIIEGEWEIFQDEIAYTLKADDIIFLHAKHHHYGIKPCSENVKLLFIVFEDFESDQVVINNQGFDSTHYYFNTQTNCKNDINIKNIFTSLIYDFWSDDKYTHVKVSAFLDILLCELSKIDIIENKLNYPHVYKIIHLIKNTPKKFLSIQEISSYVFLSAKTICSHFKMVTGVSIHAYQMDVKLRMAHDLILYNPTITLKELANIYGFYDEYHFSKCFKNKYLYSPKRNI